MLSRTLGPAQNERQQTDAKKTARWRRVLKVIELINTVVNDSDAKESARCSWCLL